MCFARCVLRGELGGSRRRECERCLRGKEQDRREELGERRAVHRGGILPPPSRATSRDSRSGTARRGELWRSW